MREAAAIEPIASKRAFVLAGLGLAQLALTRTATAADDEAAAKLPAKVRDAAARVAAKAKWSGVETDQQDDREVFELTGTDSQGRNVILEITDEGKVQGLRTELPLTKVPKNVWKSVAKKYPKFEAMTAYELREADDLKNRDDGELSYEVSGLYAEELQTILEVSPDGEIGDLEQEISPADLPEAVQNAVTGKLPMLQLTTAYEITQDEKIVGYQLTGKRGKGKKAKEIGLYVSADGSDVQIDE